MSFGLRDGWRTLGANVSELSVVGGGARSTFWVQLLASALNLPLLTHSSSEAGGALGAARLAWLADGGSEAEVCLQPPVAARYEPDAAVHQRLLLRHARFVALYGVAAGSPNS